MVYDKNLFKKRRQALGLTISELALKLYNRGYKVPESTLRRYEKDINIPFERGLMLCDVLKINPNELKVLKDELQNRK